MSREEALNRLRPTTENASALRHKILGILIKLHAYRSVKDIESLAHDIFIEAWTLSKPVTFEFIRHRMLNAIRNQKLYDLRVLDFSRNPEPARPTDILLIRETLSRIMKRAGTTSTELQVIYQIIYRGFTYAQAAHALGKSEDFVRTTFTSAIAQLQAAGRMEEK